MGKVKWLFIYPSQLKNSSLDENLCILFHMYAVTVWLMVCIADVITEFTMFLVGII